MWCDLFSPSDRMRLNISSSQPYDENVAWRIKGHLISTVVETFLTPFFQATAWFQLEYAASCKASCSSLRSVNSVNPVVEHVMSAFASWRQLRTQCSCISVAVATAFHYFQEVNMRNWIWVQEPRWKSCETFIYLFIYFTRFSPCRCTNLKIKAEMWNVLLAAEECWGVNGFKPKWGGKSVSFI